MHRRRRYTGSDHVANYAPIGQSSVRSFAGDVANLLLLLKSEYRPITRIGAHAWTNKRALMSAPVPLKHTLLMHTGAEACN